MPCRASRIKNDHAPAVCGCTKSARPRDGRSEGAARPRATARVGGVCLGKRRSANLLKDPQFTLSRPLARAWRRCASRAAVRIDGDGAAIECDSPQEHAGLSQIAAIKGGRHYRIDLVLSGTASLAAAGRRREAGGIGFELRVLRGRRAASRAGAPGWRRLVHAADEPTMLTAYFKAPDAADRIEVRVGCFEAAGTVRLHLARLMRIVKPEAFSHVLALPAPSYAYPLPRRVESVAIYDAEQGSGLRTQDSGLRTQESGFGVQDLLRRRLGEHNVCVLDGDSFGSGAADADALILRGDAPPRGLRSLKTLCEWGKRRLVIVSLPVFASLSRGAATLRTVEQEDDPIHARVVFANFITRGLALADVFPYAWTGRAAGWQVQRQFKLGARFKELCRREGWITVLESLCESEANSHRPICLYQPIDGGGVVVLDLDPIDDPGARRDSRTSDPGARRDSRTSGLRTSGLRTSDPGARRDSRTSGFRTSGSRTSVASIGSCDGRSSLAMYLLGNVLGFEQWSAGQYTVPASDGQTFRTEVAELAVRFSGVRVHGSPGPLSAKTRQLVRLGGDDDLRPAADRPLILIRTGLSGDDFEAVYGAFYFAKQLVRPPPYDCPYADELLAAYRLAWIPLCTDWNWAWGLERRVRPARGTLPDGIAAGDGDWLDGLLDVRAERVATLIDVATVRRHRSRIVFAARTDLWQQAGSARDVLRRSIGRRFHVVGPPGADLDDHRDRDWRFNDPTLDIDIDPAQFCSELHRTLLAAGTTLIRLEVPGCPGDFVAHSIWRTEWAASLLEQVVGLQIGGVVVNRSGAPLELDGRTLAPGQWRRLREPVGEHDVRELPTLEVHGAA